MYHTVNNDRMDDTERLQYQSSDRLVTKLLLSTALRKFRCVQQYSRFA